MSAVSLTGITRYLVKSCRGEALSSAVVEPWGLAGDRRWMLVDEAGVTLTARQCPQLVLVVPALVEDGLALTAPDLDPLMVPQPDGSVLVKVNVWGDPFDAALASREACAWFAVNLIPDTAGGSLHVDDELEVLEQVDDPTPQR